MQCIFQRDFVIYNKRVTLIRYTDGLPFLSPNELV